jgi:hypothetical protein
MHQYGSTGQHNFAFKSKDTQRLKHAAIVLLPYQLLVLGDCRPLNAHPYPQFSAPNVASFPAHTLALLVMSLKMTTAFHLAPGITDASCVAISRMQLIKPALPPRPAASKRPDSSCTSPQRNTGMQHA